MPSFERLPLQEAQLKTATGKRAQRLREYVDYIQQVSDGSAGKLSPASGETPTAVRRRLNQAAQMVGKELTIKRLGDEVYFWLQPGQGQGPRRRGRPRKNPLS